MQTLPVIVGGIGVSGLEFSAARIARRKVQHLAGISDEEVARYKAPADYRRPAAAVPQPAYDPSKPHLAYPPAAYERILHTPDEAFWNSVRHARPLAVGLNCALGAKEMRPYIAELARVADTFICDAIGHVSGPAPEHDLDNVGLQETPFAEPGTGPVVAPALPADLAERLKKLDADIAALTKQREAEAAKELYPVAYGVSEDKPVNARIQLRGEPEKPGDEVPRRFLEVLGGDKLPAGSTNSGRLELAVWLTRPSNPLTARVFVNRVWQWHFGQGLVPDSFAGYKTQRFRWAYGAVQILKRHWREMLPGAKRLTAAQKYHFITGWLPWFASCGLATEALCKCLKFIRTQQKRKPHHFTHLRCGPAF